MLCVEQESSLLESAKSRLDHKSVKKVEILLRRVQKVCVRGFLPLSPESKVNDCLKDKISLALNCNKTKFISYAKIAKKVIARANRPLVRSSTVRAYSMEQNLVSGYSLPFCSRPTNGYSGQEIFSKICFYLQTIGDFSTITNGQGELACYWMDCRDIIASYLDLAFSIGQKSNLLDDFERCEKVLELLNDVVPLGWSPLEKNTIVVLCA